MRADVCLIGACALHSELGLGINDVEEAALQRAFVAAASEVVALVTADKLQTVALAYENDFDPVERGSRYYKHYEDDPCVNAPETTSFDLLAAASLPTRGP